MDYLVKPWFSHVVAVTGTIGSGKSTVMELLKKRGAFVVSADDLAHQVVEPNSPGLSQVVSRFGSSILNSDGSLNRKELSQIVFADSAKKHELEAIIHPLIAEMAEKLFVEAIKAGATKLFYETPLLFEAGLDKKGFKKIVVVTASDEVCIERAMKRDGISREAAAQRLRAQMPTSEKQRRANIIIENSGSLEQLEKRVNSLFDEI